MNYHKSRITTEDVIQRVRKEIEAEKEAKTKEFEESRLSYEYEASYHVGDFSFMELYELIKVGCFDFSMIISQIWTKKQKTNFIELLLLGVPPYACHAFKRENCDENYPANIVIDGCQRLQTIYSFLNDEFALSKGTHDWCNKKFTALPRHYQRTLLETYMRLFFFGKIDHSKTDKQMVENLRCRITDMYD